MQNVASGVFNVTYKWLVSSYNQLQRGGARAVN